MTAINRVWIVLLLTLAACSTGTATPAGSAPESSLPSTPADASPVAEVLGAIVFDRDGGLYTINADGTGERLVHDSWDGIGLSRDGATLFSATPAPDGRLLPLIIQADGSGEYWLPVADPNLQLGIGDWSPDGTRLVFDAWDDTDASRKGIYSLSLDGTDLVRLTDAGLRANIPAYSGAYSPDGERVLFFSPVAEVDADSGPMNLFVVNVDGTGLVQMNPPDTTTALIGPSGASDWSPDGQHVAFVASGEVFVVGSDGSNPVRITESGSSRTVQWSPDGQLLALTLGRDIATVRPDGADLKLVTSSEDGARSFGAMWSPDSSQLLFGRSAAGGIWDLWIVNADGTNPVQVAPSSGGYGYEWVP